MRAKQALKGLILITLLLANSSCTQATRNNEEPVRLPVIDMHVHAYGKSSEYGAKDYYGNSSSANFDSHFKETYHQFRKHNIVTAVVSGPLQSVETWKSQDIDNRIICGIALNSPDDDGMTPERFEQLIKEGEIGVFGELAPYYAGMTLSDPRWKPYLEICEQFDIPVAVHTGGGPAEVTHTWAPKARLTLSDPFLIEDVLVKYPKLRLYIMHSGQVWHDHALRLMAMYPKLYSDLGVLLWFHPLGKLYGRIFLANAKEAGCLDRVMFGSDQMFWPHGIEMSIDYLNTLDFLTEEDKRDILYNNAAKFLKLEK